MCIKHIREIVTGHRAEGTNRVNKEGKVPGVTSEWEEKEGHRTQCPVDAGSWCGSFSYVLWASYTQAPGWCSLSSRCRNRQCTRLGSCSRNSQEATALRVHTLRYPVPSGMASSLGGGCEAPDAMESGQNLCTGLFCAVFFFVFGVSEQLESNIGWRIRLLALMNLSIEVDKGSTVIKPAF